MERRPLMDISDFVVDTYATYQMGIKKPLTRENQGLKVDLGKVGGVVLNLRQNKNYGNHYTPETTDRYNPRFLVLLIVFVNRWLQCLCVLRSCASPLGLK